MRKIDQIDIEILAELEEDARISIIELTRRLGYPGSTIRDRIRRMEEDGIIEGYHTILDHTKLGFNIKAIIQITSTHSDSLEETISAVGPFPEVTNIQFVTGEVDELITIYARDVNHLKDILYSKFNKLNWQSRLNTMIILHEQPFPFVRNLKV